ncbi:MAG: hypothetical protein R2749_30380 [Acidimicrobiales bacterium]
MFVTLVWTIIGVAIGAIGYHTAVVRAPGRPVGPYEQAVIKKHGQPVLIDGPAWLSVWDSYNVVGIYDVTDKRLAVQVEPAYALLPPSDDPDALPRQRFYAEMVIVYRPVDMVKILRLGDDIDEWLASHVRTAVRAHALTQKWDAQDSGEQYADAVRQRLLPLQVDRGIRLVEVYCERLGVRTPGEMEARAKGGKARELGREGLVLTYLETLQEMATSPSTKILLPTEMSGDPDAVLRAQQQ